MSSCLSGGGRTAYGIDLEIIKSLSTSTITSHSSSPSSTISESSNSPGAISTQKAQTSRKRHNQTYGEAVALLSTAYPNIFSANDFFKPCRFIKSHEFSSFCFEDSSDELLMPFSTDKPPFQIDSAVSEKPCLNDTHDYGCQTNASKLCDGYEAFDAESILDEEIEDGVIDSIMGVAQEEKINDCHNANGGSSDVGGRVDFCYGYPLGLGLGLDRSIDFGFVTAREGILKAFRQNDDGDWWKCPTVNMSEISPRFNKPMLPQKKKKKKKKTKKLMNLNDILSSSVQSKENSVPVAKPILAGKEVSTPNPKSSSTSCIESSAGMILKLNYDEVLKACSDKGSPYSVDLPGSEFSGTDVMTRLTQIDLFGENGGLREASVQRYKEKRRSRLFSKKIRYHVRKVNAEQRPRVKGRFVRSLNSSGGEETRTE